VAVAVELREVFHVAVEAARPHPLLNCPWMSARQGLSSSRLDKEALVDSAAPQVDEGAPMALLGPILHSARLSPLLEERVGKAGVLPLNRLLVAALAVKPR
jgi:hypothetical protein